MGLASELHFTVRPANGLQRAGQKLGSSRPGARVFSKILAPMDRLLYRLTKGRLGTAQILAGLPVIMVTTTGRKSGQPRRSPLVGVPIGDDLALVGTNFGQRSTPSWVYNLDALPEADVTYRDRSVRVDARDATAAERAEILRVAGGVYPGYDLYQERISNRPIRIFVLTPAH